MAGDVPADVPASAPAPDARPPSRRRGRIRAAFLVVALAFAVGALAAQWGDVGDRLDDLSAPNLVASVAFAAAALVAAFLAWRETLAELAERLPLRVAGRIFFLGQVGKYVPGSIWALVSQAELARTVGIRRERTAIAGVVVLVVSLAVALVIGLLAVPALLDTADAAYLGVLVVLVPLGVVLHPRVLTALVGRGLRLLRRPALDRPLAGATILRVAGLSVASNALLGLQVWALAADLADDPGLRLVALALGGYGLAAAISLVVIPLPAGAGLREALLVAVLAPEVGVAGATLVALIARVTLTALDLASAGVAALATPAVAEAAAERGDLPG